jgi:hypothetical protein
MAPNSGTTKKEPRVGTILSIDVGPGSFDEEQFPSRSSFRDTTITGSLSYIMPSVPHEDTTKNSPFTAFKGTPHTTKNSPFTAFKGTAAPTPRRDMPIANESVILWYRDSDQWQMQLPIGRPPPPALTTPYIKWGETQTEADGSFSFKPNKDNYNPPRHREYLVTFPGRGAFLPSSAHWAGQDIGFTYTHLGPAFRESPNPTEKILYGYVYSFVRRDAPELYPGDFVKAYRRHWDNGWSAWTPVLDQNGKDMIYLLKFPIPFRLPFCEFYAHKSGWKEEQYKIVFQGFPLYTGSEQRCWFSFNYFSSESEPYDVQFRD